MQQTHQELVLATSNPNHKQIIVRGTCEGKGATFFVDTGSSVSLISQHFVDNHRLTHKVKPTNLSLKSFTSDKIKTYGEIAVRIAIAGRSVTHILIVTDLLDTHCLMGMDLLKACKANIDIEAQCLRSCSGTAPFLKQPEQLRNTATVKCRKTVTVPPNSVMFVNARTIGVHNDRCYTAHLEPKTNLLTSSALMVHSSLCHTEGSDVPVKITNFNDEPTVLYKNKVLGTLHPVDNTCDKHVRRVTVLQNSEPEWRREQRINEILLSEQKEEEKQWTKSWLYKELQIDSIDGISPADRHRLKSIVWKYRDCFSRGTYDLGECTTYEAEISLKSDFKPTWVPARPVPYLLREEMDKQIAGLEKAGVIEKCKTKSLFNSPIFLVKKPHQPHKMRFVVDMRMVNT